MSARPFEVICEIEPATRPDLVRVRQQIGVLSAITSRFLIPDNHIGRATVSSIAVAHEVTLMGGAMACLNARDRNVLGFRRDLLTAAAYGVDEFLFVYGDKPARRRADQRADGPLDDRGGTRLHGRRTRRSPGPPPWRIGVAAGLRPLPRWKRAADFIFSQVSYSADAQLRWRDANPADVPVYAGVMVLASAGDGPPPGRHHPRHRDPRAGSPTRSARDTMAGVDAACEQITATARQRRLRRRPPGARQPLPGNLRTPGSTHLTRPG